MSVSSASSSDGEPSLPSSTASSTASSRCESNTTSISSLTQTEPRVREWPQSFLVVERKHIEKRAKDILGNPKHLELLILCAKGKKETKTERQLLTLVTEDLENIRKRARNCIRENYLTVVQARARALGLTVPTCNAVNAQTISQILDSIAATNKNWEDFVMISAQILYIPIICSGPWIEKAQTQFVEETRQLASFLPPAGNDRKSSFEKFAHEIAYDQYRKGINLRLKRWGNGMSLLKHGQQKNGIPVKVPTFRKKEGDRDEDVVDDGNMDPPIIYISRGNGGENSEAERGDSTLGLGEENSEAEGGGSAEEDESRDEISTTKPITTKPDSPFMKAVRHAHEQEMSLTDFQEKMKEAFRYHEKVNKDALSREQSSSGKSSSTTVTTEASKALPSSPINQVTVNEISRQWESQEASAASETSILNDGVVLSPTKKAAAIPKNIDVCRHVSSVGLSTTEGGKKSKYHAEPLGTDVRLSFHIFLTQFKLTKLFFFFTQSSNPAPTDERVRNCSMFTSLISQIFPQHILLHSFFDVYIISNSGNPNKAEHLPGEEFFSHILFRC